MLENNGEKNNIEYLIYECSKNIVSEIRNINDKSKRNKVINLIDKALSVLSNDGVYAYYVFIISKQKDDAKKYFLEPLKDIFRKIKNEKDFNGNDYESYFLDISKDLRKLLLLKQILERILIYVRYLAKAEKENFEEEDVL